MNTRGNVRPSRTPSGRRAADQGWHEEDSRRPASRHRASDRAAVGQADRFVPLDLAESASARLGWPLDVIEDAGYVPHIERDRRVRACAGRRSRPGIGRRRARSRIACSRRGDSPTSRRASARGRPPSGTCAGVAARRCSGPTGVSSTSCVRHGMSRRTASVTTGSGWRASASHTEGLLIQESSAPTDEFRVADESCPRTPDRATSTGVPRMPRSPHRQPADRRSPTSFAFYSEALGFDAVGELADSTDCPSRCNSRSTTACASCCDPHQGLRLGHRRPRGGRARAERVHAAACASRPMPASTAWSSVRARQAARSSRRPDSSRGYTGAFADPDGHVGWSTSQTFPASTSPRRR